MKSNLINADGRFVGPTSGNVSHGVATSTEDHERNAESFDILDARTMTLDALWTKSVES
jgi:hypothetical protein